MSELRCTHCNKTEGEHGAGVYQNLCMTWSSREQLYKPDGSGNSWLPTAQEGESEPQVGVCLMHHDGPHAQSKLCSGWIPAKPQDEPKRPILPPLGDRTHQLETEEIMVTIQGTDYLKESVARMLHSMTSGQRYSLYRAVMTLIDQKRAEKAANHE